MEEKVSVIMGIYNCDDTLREAVESLQSQSFENWELIMCDDGSTDNTFETANALRQMDRRIILLKNNKNIGLNNTLNKCLSIASGKYIARMDGDDICDPSRFEKQVAFLKNHDDYSIVSSWMSMFDESGEWGIRMTPEYPNASDVVTGNPICHAPAMMKKECLDKVGGYYSDNKVLRVEDVDLWIRLYAAGYRAYNIQEPLYSMRNDSNAFNRRKYKYRINSTRVRLNGCRALKLSPVCYLKAFKPMLIGLIPAGIRRLIKKRRNGVQ